MEPASDNPAAVIAFGRFLLSPHRRELLVDGQPIKLGDRAFDVLMVLIEARGSVVSKDALMARVWRSQVVAENNLEVHISALRTAFGADRALIRTIARQGYQFTGEFRFTAEDAKTRVNRGAQSAAPAENPPHLVSTPPMVRDDGGMLADRAPVYALGECEIDLSRRELRLAGAPVPLGARAFHVIEVLVRSAGQLVTKDELYGRIWPDQIVNDNTLQSHIVALRTALGPQRGLLKTEAGRGYRLLGDWTVRSHDTAVPPIVRLSPASRAEGPPATNLPVALASLIGRTAASQYLRDLVSAYRLVTLTGPGGIGKTSLALQVARDLVGEFADGSWFVEFASLSDPGLVPSAVASVLGLTLSDTISSATVAGAIGRLHLLVILDNCEHVIGGVAELVETIVSRCPNITLLTTSREVIRVDGEYVYRVPPLEVPAQDAPRDILDHSAVELFIARAKGLGYSPNADAVPLIATICRHLDGIPLAIEFAAARAATLGIRHIAGDLSDRLALLTSGHRTALPRQRTLRATLDWSYDLLKEEERLLLSRLAVFPRGFTVDGAVAVSGDELDEPIVINGIASLVEKSLVTVDALAVGSRWRLLETIRSYALGKLSERGDADDAARRHAAYFRDLSVPIVTDFGLRVSTVDAVAYAREIDNVRAALDWCFSPTGDASIGIDLTAAYAPVWLNLSLVAECRERCERALCRLDATEQSNARLRMRLEMPLGNALLHSMGPSEEAETVLTDAVAIADALGDPDAQVRALSILSSVFVFRGEYARAQTAVERIRQIAQKIGDPYIASIADRAIGITLMSLGQLGAARLSLERAVQSSLFREDDPLPLWRQGGDRSLARASLARVLWLQGFAEAALYEAELSCEEAKGAHAQDQLSICRAVYYGIGRIASMTGDFVAAEDAITELIEFASSRNAPFWVTAGRFLRGKHLVERGEFADGLACLREAFGTCEEAGWRLSYPEFMGSLASALAGLGRLGAAKDAVSTAIARAGGREHGQQWYVPELLRIKAEILLRQSVNHSGLAADCLQQAATMARQQGALAWELRIALSLARLRLAQGRRDEASQILAPVYHRFTEGFATSDLLAARAMLDTLPTVTRSRSGTSNGL